MIQLFTIEIIVKKDRNSWRFAKRGYTMDFRSLKPYVRQAVEKKFKAPSELSVRWLVAYQIAIVTAGEGALVTDKRSYEISEGDVLFIPPNVAHSYSIERDVSMLIIGFDTSYSEISRMRNTSSTIPPENLPQYRKIYLQNNIYEDYDLPYIFKPENIDEYIRCWKEIKNAVQKNNSYATEIRMTKLLNLLHERLGITKIKTKVDICEIVKDFIDAGYEKIITLDEIASLYEVNKFTISKKFKDRYGISIIAYYNEKRLSYAKRELSNPSVTVSFVSETLNFTDVYTFSKFFKMHTGMSPRAFKTRSAADEG